MGDYMRVDYLWKERMFILEGLFCPTRILIIMLYNNKKCYPAQWDNQQTKWITSSLFQTVEGSTPHFNTAYFAYNIFLPWICRYLYCWFSPSSMGAVASWRRSECGWWTATRREASSSVATCQSMRHDSRWRSCRSRCGNWQDWLIMSWWWWVFLTFSLPRRPRTATSRRNISTSTPHKQNIALGLFWVLSPTHLSIHPSSLRLHVSSPL